MAIKIKRNEAGNCITFQGSSNPVYWNSCLSGEVDSQEPNSVNIINDVITSELPSGEKAYEFFRIPYTEFVNAEGNVFSSATETAEYITEVGNVVSPDFGIYKGEWDASTDFNPPSSPNGGDWYFVSNGGNKNPNDIGGVDLVAPISGDTYYNTNDVVKYNGTNWGHIPNETVRVRNIEESALGMYDIYVDSDYVPNNGVGSNLRPYNTLSSALSNSTPGQNILVKGVHEIPSTLTLPHALNLYGIAGETEIKFASYNTSNGDIINFVGTNTEEIIIKDIVFRNAGGYGLLIKKVDVFELRNCKFYNNGWDGTQLHTVLPSSVSGLLGYDSSSAELQAFYAGSHASNGGAVRLEEVRKPLIRENRAEGNLRGFRIQDCGINGGGFVIENQSINNIESGIYIAAGSLGGCQNITVTINYSSYNANNGKFSQNEVNGNWNAGFCAWGAVNVTLRDSGLYDNNRSQYNGIGNVGDAKASIQINDIYTYIPYQLTYNPAFRFIVEILDTQVHYTGLESNADKVGFLMTSGIGETPDNDKNIIKIDDVGFIGQDYAIDFSEVDLTNLRVSLGDNSYQLIGLKAVKAPLAGNYSELPFSNHVMQVPEVDVVVDTLKQSIALHEGVGGNVINTYKINELATDLKTNALDIIQKSSNKIQLRDLTFGNIYINGVVAGNNLNSANDSLIAAFGMDLTQYKDFLVSEVGVNGDTNSGGSLPAIANNWYVSYGPQSGTQITTPTIGNNFRNHNPFYNGEALEKGHEFIWTHNPSYSYIIGIWGAAQSPQAGSTALQPSNWTAGFGYNGTNTRFSTPDSSGVVIETSGSFTGYYGMSNGQLAIRFGQDNYLYLFEVVDGGYTLIGKSNTTVAGTSVMIQWASFNEGSFPVMTERSETWEVVADEDNSQNGEWSNGLEESTVIRSRMSFSPGEKITLDLSHFGRHETIGFGYTGTATGQASAENLVTTRLFYNTSEILKSATDDGVDWTWNTSAEESYNPNGDGTDIGYGTQSVNLGLISFRYKLDNTVELWHETDNVLMATKVVPFDGTAQNIYFGSNENNHTADRIPQLIKYDMSAEEEGASLTGWYYIESPDGQFYYPLFVTEAEGNYIDSVEGGSGTTHTHTFEDDTYNGGTNTWYMPDTNGVHAGTSAPQGGIFGNSINVVWNEIPTGDDSNYLPTFNNITYNVQEGSAINIQYKAQGMTETFNVTGIPNGYADNGYAIIGTAEDITNGYGQSIQHVINVTKANNIGSVQGTITINVLANLAGNEFTLVDQGGVIKFTQDGGLTVLDFNTVTFNAGSTYKFYLDGVTLQTNDIVNIVDANGNGILGNDGLTQIGAGAGYAGAHFQYTIPSDVAPGKFITFTDGATSTNYSNVPLTLAGSTYTANPTGITLEGPASNQTGGNVMDSGQHGWINLGNFAAGERLVLDNAFFADFLGEVKGTNTIFAIGLKGDNWTNTKQVNSNGAAASGNTFKGNTYIVGIWNSSGTSLTMWICANGILGNSMYMNTPSLWNSACAFLEITNSGDNIRSGFGYNGNLGITAGDESTVTYANWNAYKGQTGDQGYGISTLDVVMSFWTFDGDAIDGNEIDWTGLSEISIPNAPTMDTSWTKAIDFSGGNEHLKQVGSGNTSKPLAMGYLSTTVSSPTVVGNTSNHSSARPWATAIVFKIDGNNSNQHIWNYGEGTGSNDDNIALRLSASKNLYLHWGRSGSENECQITSGGVLATNQWYGVYIAHNGTRLSANNATATNLAAAFDIRIMTSSDLFTSLGSNLSTTSTWLNTGDRMDRSITGDFTIGGRGSNRNFHGKVASMVVTTLKQNVAMPTDAEIEMMITDPVKWLTDYKVGQTYRIPHNGHNNTVFALNTATNSARATQVLLMGDTSTDALMSNGIRNYVMPTEQNETRLQGQSLQSNGEVNVTIPGLS